MMMKFSVAAKEVISEVCANARKRYTAAQKKVNAFFSWSNVKNGALKLFRATFGAVRSVGAMLRECFLSMMLDIFSGILPIVKWVVRIAVIALPVSYAVPPTYGLTDFVWPALFGSVALYMFVSFFTKVFDRMLNKRPQTDYRNEAITRIYKDENCKCKSDKFVDNFKDENQEIDKCQDFVKMSENNKA